MTSILDTINSFIEKHKLRENLIWLNCITILLCGWLLLYHILSNEILFLIIVFIPVLGIALRRRAGKKSLDDYIQSLDFITFFNFYYIDLYIAVASIALALRVFWDFEFENLYSLLTHVGIVFAFLISLFLLTHKKITGSPEHKFIMYGMFSIVVFLYSYSAVYGINCLYDYSDPVQFKTTVLTKWIQVDKQKRRRRSILFNPTHSYKITVAPWGNNSNRETLNIPYEQYNMFEAGDSVYVDVQSGLFGIPWYHLDDQKILHRSR